MTAKDKIAEIATLLGINLVDESVEVKLEQTALKNGTIIEADAFEDGAAVFVVSDEDRVPLPVGDYTLEDGRQLTVTEEGVIATIGEAEAAEPEAEEEMESEASEFVTRAEFDELKATVNALTEKLRAEEVTETVEASAEETPAKEVEEAAEVVEVEASKDKPAAEPIKANPEKEVKRESFAHLFKNGSSSTPADLIRDSYQKLYKSKG